MTVTRESAASEIAAVAGVSSETVRRWRRDPEGVSKGSRTAIEKSIGEATATAKKLDNMAKMLAAMKGDIDVVRAIIEERAAAEGAD